MKKLIVLVALANVASCAYLSLSQNPHNYILRLLNDHTVPPCNDGKAYIDFSSLHITEWDAGRIQSENNINISLSNNNLTKIPDDGFENAPILICLDVSRNLIPTHDLLSFGHKRLKTLNLSFQRYYYNYTSEYESGFINTGIDEASQLPELKYLDLSGNHIRYLPQNFATALPTLQHLYLNDLVRTTDLTYDFFNDLPESLISLHLCNNNINYLNFPMLKNIKALYVNGNPLYDVGHSLQSKDLILLSLKNCTLTEIDSIFLTNLPLLLILDASWNRLSHLNDIQHREIRVLALDHNRFVNIPNLSGLPNLEKLSLSNNDIRHVAFHLEPLNLVELDLHGNSIQTIDEYAFATALKLKTIDLSDNLLTTIPVNTFTPTTSLAVLGLRNNQFRRFEDIFGPKSVPRELTDLYIKGNPLEYVDTRLFRILPEFCRVHVY